MLFKLEGEGLSKKNDTEICLSPLVAVPGIWLIRRIPTQPFPHPTIPPSPRSLGSWALLETVVLQGRVFSSFILYELELERRAIVPLAGVTPPTPFPKLQHQAEQLFTNLLESGMEITLCSSPVLTLSTQWTNTPWVEVDALPPSSVKAFFLLHSIPPFLRQHLMNSRLTLNSLCCQEGSRTLNSLLPPLECQDYRHG